VNLQNDPNNCGSCGNECAAGKSCVSGKCGLAKGAVCTMDQQCASNHCNGNVFTTFACSPTNSFAGCSCL
jgi:hypothetical protein